MAALTSLQLCACSLTDKEYVVVRDYLPSEQQESHAGGRFTVNSLSAIKSALLNMAYEGRTEGNILFETSYEGDALDDLETACRTVRMEDALCAYCVENISYSFNKIVTINEATVKISYSKVSEKPERIVHIGFSSEAEAAILNAMKKGQGTLALLVGNSGFSADDMAAQVNKAYCRNPASVPKKPETVVNVFSGSGTQRLYEIQINYGMSASELQKCRRELLDFRPFEQLDKESKSEVELAYAACNYLVDNCTITDNKEQNSAYSALIDKKANSEGLAFGYVELCRQLNVDCQIVYGQHDWEEHYWNIVRLDDSYYHVDITQCAKGGPALGFMQNDDTFWRMYRWDVASYPQCTGTKSFFDFFPPTTIDTRLEGSTGEDS